MCIMQCVWLTHGVQPFLLQTRLLQGDANGAMAQLLAWAATH